MTKKILMYCSSRQAAEQYFFKLTSHKWHIGLIQEPNALQHLVGEQEVDLLILVNIEEGSSNLPLLISCIKRPDLPVMMLNETDHTDHRIRCFEHGAHDVVPRDAKAAEIRARIEASLRIGRHANGIEKEAVLSFNNITLNPNAREAYCGGHHLKLTSREFNVLHLLMLNTGAVVSKADLTRKALHAQYCQYSRGVDAHVSNLRKKIAAFDLSEKVATIRGVGYQFLT